MPISSFQAGVLRLLAANRGPDSYIADGIAINRSGPRFSNDIDIFHDSTARQEAAIKADTTVLESAGYMITAAPHQRSAKHEATILKNGDQMQLEWATDSAFRFFPAKPDALFGYVLHPVDLATNKAAAAADRRVPRDIVDLVTIHDTILPLGAVVAAACGKFIGTTPEEMLAEITRHSRFIAEEFQSLATEHPIEPRALHRRIQAMIEVAAGFIAKLPSDAVGVVFMDGETPVQPSLALLQTYRRVRGALSGVWPSSPDIDRNMLDRHGETEGMSRGTKRPNRINVRIPTLEPLDQYCPDLCRMVAKTSWLPHPDTVAALNRQAVFRTTRNSAKRITGMKVDGKTVGMYDDNTTPRWALLWSHGMGDIGRKSGWTFAHVWQAASDVQSYTNLANLLMTPECFASLTDKNGPLTRYLRWHALKVYTWKPEKEPNPVEPEGYADIQWQYFPKFDDPRKFIEERLAELKNARVRFLRSL